MSKKLLIVFAASALFLMACDVSGIVTQFLPGGIRDKIVQGLSPTEEPTQPPAPTAQPITLVTPGAPPRTTPGQPPAPPPSTGNPFADALNKAKNAQKFRFEVSWVFGATKNGKYAEEPFLDMSGEVDGKNSHMTTKAGIFAALSGGGTLEIIEADGKAYWKGVSLLGLTDPKQWYIQKDTSSTSSFQDFAKPDYWNSFSSSNPGDFKKVRNEAVDGQSCDVYANDVKNLPNSAMTGLLGSAQDKNAFSAIDKAETDFWLCGDGFVHKFAFEFLGHDQKNPADKGGMKWNGHFSDFNNAAIKVTAPQGAKPMPGQ